MILRGLSNSRDYIVQSIDEEQVEKIGKFWDSANEKSHRFAKLIKISEDASL
jgi:hypothetical protein